MQPKYRTLVRISYKWFHFSSSHTLKELEIENVDDNFFKTKKEAIAFLEREKKKDENFCDGYTFILQKFYFI